METFNNKFKGKGRIYVDMGVAVCGFWGESEKKFPHKRKQSQIFENKLHILLSGALAAKTRECKQLVSEIHFRIHIRRQVKLHATPPPPPQEQNLLQKEIRSTKSVYIPR